MNLEAAVQQPSTTGTNQLVGDLSSLPNPHYRLVDSDIYAFQWALPYSGSDRPFLESLIQERTRQLEAELAAADPLLNALLIRTVNHQLRSRPSFERSCIVVEQWIPALRCWLVNGYFPYGTPHSYIVSTLERGDPRKKTAEQDLAERREAAAKVQKANDDAHTLKVIDTVNSLGSERIERFIQVEKAMHTGETITVREDDRRQIESLYEQTRDAAHKGDVEAQQVLTRGQRDNPTCLLPSTNPLRHRHRAEREQDPKAK